MSLKEKLDVALTLYAKEVTPEFRSAVQKIIAEYDEKRKAFDFCLDELAITKNQLAHKDRDIENLQSDLAAREDEIAVLRDRLGVQEQGVKEMEALLMANDDQIKEYLQERERKEIDYENRIGELDRQLHVELENRLQLRVQGEVLDKYVQVCNNLFARNRALSRQVLDYEEKINKGCCTRMLGIKLTRTV